jgi:hypothetical protein
MTSSPLLRQAVAEAAKARFRIGRGSYSCINDMEHLGCCGVNVGCGYHNQHSNLCYAEVDETTKMVDLFARFYAEHHTHHFEHKAPDIAPWIGGAATASGTCAICGAGGWTVACAYLPPVRGRRPV